MGRGRGKGKKQTAITARDDNGSGDEKLPARRRGRPQKPMKDEFEEEYEVEKIEEEDSEVEESKDLVLSKSSKNQSTAENGRKRKRPSQIKENDELVKEDNATVLIKSVGYRQIGSRRKNKPRRAAEVGVECKNYRDSGLALAAIFLLLRFRL